MSWFSRLLRNPARKWRGSILSTPELARGTVQRRRVSVTFIEGIFQRFITKLNIFCRGKRFAVPSNYPFMVVNELV